MQLIPSVRQQFFDDNGDPLAGGKVFTYIAGTSTPLDTYTDQGGGTPNSNPIILDSAGIASIWIGTAVYKLVVKDSLDNVLQTIDNVELLADGSVTAAKIAAGAVTQAKLGTKTVVNAPLTIASTSSLVAIPATGACAITTTGRPVSVRLIGEALAGVPAFFKIHAPLVVPAIGTIELWRDLTRISAQSFGGIRSNTGTLLSTFTANGTMTAPESGKVYVRGCGGGGGGGAGYGSPFGGGGGGAASATVGHMLNCVAGETLTVAIGAAGTAGSGGPGGAGGDTTITGSTSGLLLKIKGGPGGLYDSAGAAQVASLNFGGYGGAGGASSGGTGASGGTVSLNPIYAGGAAGAGGGSNGWGSGGGGGASAYGPGGAGGPNNTTPQFGVAPSGTSYGAGGGGGGGGGGGNSVGAAGAGGYMEIYDTYAFVGGSYDQYGVPSVFGCVDTVAAGSYSYSLKYFVSDASAVLSTSGTISIQAYEL